MVLLAGLERALQYYVSCGATHTYGVSAYGMFKCISRSLGGPLASLLPLVEEERSEETASLLLLWLRVDVHDGQTWWQAPLQFLGLFWVVDRECVKVS